MSKEETSSGLLSKMVRFVRNPATNWSDLDNKETGRDEALSKQLLKEMIERKRRNDFVRKREFDMLRKMRKREALDGHDPGARPSFFQSSMPSKPDDRAQTLKKIDEIEAQMSMQWWKTSPRSSLDSVSPGDRNSPGGAPRLEDPQPQGYGVTEPVALRATPDESAANASAVQRSGQLRTNDMDPTEPAPLQQRSPMVSTTSAKSKSAVANGLSWDGGNYDGTASGFTASNMMAIDVAEVAHDAELEEASIRFANGDDAGAEAGLLEMLAPQGSRVGNPDTWLALFDLYRATGQHDKFENSAIQFVQRFDRSAPQWFSMPEIVRGLTPAAVRPQGNGPSVDWICPSVVGIQTVAALNAALVRAPMPWRLDWSNLKTIEATAVESLYKVFCKWSAQPVQLRFIGEGQLLKVLFAATPSGERETLQECWQLRMEALRVTHHPDEFELAALDFCVTYEVSPPAWASALCEYKPLDPEGLAIAGHTIIGEVFRDSVHSGISSLMEGDTQMEGHSLQTGQQIVTVELSGLIEGDAIAVLDQLEAKLQGADIMIISCAKLIRVDFSAAGTLLNWVSAREAEHRSIQFSEVNRLVAAFFNVIGITEHARVATRLD